MRTLFLWSSCTVSVVKISTEDVLNRVYRNQLLLLLLERVPLWAQTIRQKHNSNSIPLSGPMGMIHPIQALVVLGPWITAIFKQEMVLCIVEKRGFSKTLRNSRPAVFSMRRLAMDILHDCNTRDLSKHSEVVRFRHKGGWKMPRQMLKETPR